MYHPGGIDSMGSIPGLLKSFKIPSLATLAESIPGLLESLQIRTLLFLLCSVHYTISKERVFAVLTMTVLKRYCDEKFKG